MEISPIGFVTEERRLAQVIEAVRKESGCDAGSCPLCNSKAFDSDSGDCPDCGISILADWDAGQDS